MTNIYELDGACMRDRASAHDYLQETLGFPDWYGKNLDALYDLLTEMTEETFLFIQNADDADPAVMQTLTDAMESNPLLNVIPED